MWMSRNGKAAARVRRLLGAFLLSSVSSTGLTENRRTGGVFRGANMAIPFGFESDLIIYACSFTGLHYFDAPSFLPISLHGGKKCQRAWKDAVCPMGWVENSRSGADFALVCSSPSRDLNSQGGSRPGD